jgi:hypothetical protein
VARDEEKVALDALALYLDAAGEPITLLRRPDLEVRDKPAVDFEVAWRGETVGVEVTSASAYMADLLSADELESAIEEGLRPLVEDCRLGTIALHFSYHERPRRHEIEDIAERAVDAVSSLLTNGAPKEMQVCDPPHPLKTLRVTRHNPSRHVVGRISAPIGAWWAEGEVDEFVTKLIAGKGTQGVDYSILWVVIFERTGILSADDLAAGLRRHRADLPENWRRVFYLERSTITEVFSAEGPAPTET